MKKAVVVTILLSVAAALVTACGVLLCIGLSEHAPQEGYEGWNMMFMMPESAVSIAAVTLVITDIACIVLAVMLSVSYARSVRALKKSEQDNKKTRFSRLIGLDEKYAGKRGEENAMPFNDRIPLREFCDGFRGFAASSMGLYYEPSVIRSYIAGLSCTHLMILQGISGTGKTSLPFAFGKYVCSDAAVAPVQPGWKDRSDLLGYYNEFTDSYTETELLYKLYESNYTNDICTVVLDEMNIARVEYYFAEFLSLLELPEGTSRQIRVTADSRPSDPALFDGGTLRLPGNIWFVGTANNDDSTLAISDKVYDRAFVINLDSRSRPFEAEPTPRSHISADRLKEMFREAKLSHPLSDAIRSALEKTDAYLTENLGIASGNRVLRQAESFVPVYVACGGTEEEAADILICRKMLRKLEGINPARCRAEAGGLTGFLTGLFGEGALPESLGYIEKYRAVN